MSRRPDVPHRKPVLLCWSGGKDAAWTLHALRQRDDVEVVALLSSITTDYGRSSMQGVRREVLQAQAAACGLPLLEAGIPAACDNDTYEAAMAGALAETESRWPGLHTAAFGDLLLEDRSEEHTSELQSLMRISYAVFCLKNKITYNDNKVQ